MARVFAVRVLIWLSITSVGVQIIFRMGNYPDIVKVQDFNCDR